MTKQEAIQKAYEAAGVDWDKVKEFVDDSGNCMMYDSFGKKLNLSFQEMGFTQEQYKNVFHSGVNEKSELMYRPKSLSGIDTNNGWTKIESENDLPKDNDAYFVAYSDGSVEHFLTGSWIRTFKELESNPEYPPKRILTHYQPIQKPKPPIY